MAKKSRTQQQFRQNLCACATSWENKVPAIYRSVLDGFTAEMTVGDFTDFFRAALKQPDIAIPEALRTIRIGAFTPEIFRHFAGFWDAPLDTSRLMEPEYHPVFEAMNDKDFIKVQSHVLALDGTNARQDSGFRFSTSNPTLETMARLAQTQYLGFNLRMSELTNDSMMARLAELNNPARYALLRKTGTELGIDLPATMPAFEITKANYSIKNINSAIEKAYLRTGKPDDVAAFLAEPHKFGVYGVNDMKRTRLVLKDCPDRKSAQDYIPMRNVLLVGALSGEMGFICTESTDHVLYPPSDRVKDWLPVFMMKAKMCHAGPVVGNKGSIIMLPTEIQLDLLPDHANLTTHDMYVQTRTENDLSKAEKEGIDKARLAVFHTYVSEEIVAQRHAYREKGETLIADPAKAVLKKYVNELDILKSPPISVRNAAIAYACKEFPDEVKFDDILNDGGNITEISLDNLKNHELVRKALEKIIRPAPQDKGEFFSYPACNPYGAMTY